MAEQNDPRKDLVNRGAVEHLTNQVSQSPIADRDGVLAGLSLPATNLESLDAALLKVPKETEERLSAYLASALTGLDPDKRDVVETLSDSISTLCSTFGIDVYEPRKSTDPVHHPNVSASDVYQIDRERVTSSDLVIFLSHYPSTGAGQELDFAYNAAVPIIVVSHEDRSVSRMVTGIPGYVVHISYRYPEDMRRLMEDTLRTLRPYLISRRTVMTGFDRPILARRMRNARQQRGLTIAEVADATRGHLSHKVIQRWESDSDNVSNPSLVQLRILADVLKVSVAELIEPDLHGLYLRALSSLVKQATSSGKAAARSHSMSTSDHLELIRRFIDLIDNPDHDSGPRQALE